MTIRALLVLVIVFCAADGFAQSPAPEEGRAAEAASITALQRAVQEAPGDASRFQRLSQAYAAANQPLPALEAIEHALTLKPGNAEFLRARATLATWAGDYSRALDSYRRLRTSAPNDVELALNEARVSSWSGNTDEAVAAYRRYLRARPEAAATWLELARTEWWRGNYGAALETLSEYRTRFGESAEYSRELAAVLARAGQPARAQEILEPLLRQEPDNYDLNLTRTIALATQHRTREAFDALGTVQRLQPSGRDTEDLERIVRTLLASTIEPGASFYSDSDSLDVQRVAPRAALSLATGTKLSGGYEREALTARRGSGLEQIGGELDGRHDHVWFGLAQRAGAVTLQGRVGRAAAGVAGDQHLTTYAIGADVQPFDALKFSVERSSGFFVISPRTIGLGLRRLDHRVQLDWAPTVRSQVAFTASYQELSDGNRRWEAASRLAGA